MAIIEVDHVTKEFQLGQLQSLKTTALNQLRRLVGPPPERPPPFKALDDVSFSVEQGEVVGIIGHNGAGKSTLLKLLASISTPTSGRIEVRGKVAPLIEVGAGLVGDLTGRENIYLNGSILGIPKAQIARKFDEIVAFAELEQFIDTPIKRYSSGMQVRLGFSIATSVESDILIVDEVLAVGDLSFQRKCFDRMEELIRHQNKTVLLVSHNIRQVERLCSRVIMLDHGTKTADGRSTEVCNQFFQYSNTRIQSSTETLLQGRLRHSEELTFHGIDLYDNNNQRAECLEFLEPCKFRLRFRVNCPLKRLIFMIGLHTTDFVYLSANETVEHPKDFAPGEYALTLHIASMSLLPGVYCTRAWIGTPEGRESFYGETLTSFQVRSADVLITRLQELGLVYMGGRFVVDSVV
jgi:lipopolysaccharide transport system ATP-binding protein